jgi:hypothetical protein
MLSFLKGVYLNIAPPYLDGRYLVIESDDWGSIRTSSNKALDNLRREGINVDDSLYAKIDALESNDDLCCLYEVLSRFKGGDGKPAKFTFNNVLGNPDFDRIRDSGFEDYYWEPFNETLDKYPEHDQVYRLYRQGMDEELIQVQYHAREHVNIRRWLKDLRENRGHTRLAFDNEMFTYPFADKRDEKYIEYMCVYDMSNPDEIEEMCAFTKEGLDYFEKMWSFRSISFIAPCYIWPPAIEKTLAEQGVKMLQGIYYQFEPVPGKKYKRHSHHFGKQNKYGQIYSVRNIVFEPFVDDGNYWEEKALERINLSFMLKKPAIISSHRANYIGFLDPRNREMNLKRLSSLLSRVLQKWPDVCFISTDQLATIMLEDELRKV